MHFNQLYFIQDKANGLEASFDFAQDGRLSSCMATFTVPWLGTNPLELVNVFVVDA
jgi:hypothetical protein